MKIHGPPRGLGRVARSKPTSHGPRCGPARGPSSFESMGCGSARPIKTSFHQLRPPRPMKFSGDEPRPGPAHQSYLCWAQARPCPAHVLKISARPGPAHDIFKILGPARTLTTSPENTDERTRYCGSETLPTPATRASSCGRCRTLYSSSRCFLELCCFPSSP